MYVIVRGDLSPGYQLVQSNHALVDFTIHFPKTVKTWHEQSNYIAGLQVNDEQALLDLCQQCVSNGIKCSLFREPDIEYQATALVVEPSDEARKLCSSLPLALRGGEGINKRRYSSTG